MEDQEKIQTNRIVNKDDEIDLVALAKTIWEGRKTIIRTVIIFIILGLFIAIFSQKEYTATTTMVPQINSPSSKLGGLSSLASLAGFNLDMSAGGNDISPVLYPQIVSSVPFQLEIMNSKYTFEEIEEEITLFDYYLNYYKPGVFGIIKKYTIGLPGIILNAIRGKQEDSKSDNNTDVIRITKDQYEIRKIIDEKLNLNINDKVGYLTLVAKFHQAELSAQVAQIAQKLLQKYITEFKIEKANAQYEFIEERYLETQRGFETAQSKLANYRDANKNITSAIARTEEEKLENEYQLAFEVYSELAKQLEQGRIKIKEDTPVFSVIEEVVVPVEKTKPKRSLTVIISIIFGVIIGMSLIFLKIYYLSIKKLAEID